jgi:hypothetical protein
MYGYGWKSQLSRETSFHDVFRSLVIVSAQLHTSLYLLHSNVLNVTPCLLLANIDPLRSLRG